MSRKYTLDADVEIYRVPPGRRVQTLAFISKADNDHTSNVTNFFSVTEAMKLKLKNRQKIRITIEVL